MSFQPIVEGCQRVAVGDESSWWVPDIWSWESEGTLRELCPGGRM